MKKQRQTVKKIGRVHDLTGRVFTRLTVISLHPERLRGGAQWVCRCSCEEGKTVIKSSRNLLVGDAKSCGCLNTDARRQRWTKHGKHHHPTYALWASIISRCNSNREDVAKYYKNKGIKMCEEWRADFLNFYNWAIVAGWKKGLQIDRIDGNKGYSPDNCRFVTPHKNAINQGLSSRNSSGYAGVRINRIGKWQAIIHVHNKKICLGTHIKKEDAVKARNKYVLDEGLDEDYLQTWNPEDEDIQYKKRLPRHGYVGVCFRAERNRWISYVNHNGKQIAFRQVKTKREALEARNNYIKKHHLEHQYEIQEWVDD